MPRLRGVWEAWKRIARAIGNFQARVILTILYVALIIPIGLMVRAVADPFRARHNSFSSSTSTDTYWLPRPTESDTLEAARRQF